MGGRFLRNGGRTTPGEKSNEEYAYQGGWFGRSSLLWFYEVVQCDNSLNLLGD
jgi:hypothetical protein